MRVLQKVHDRVLLNTQAYITHIRDAYVCNLAWHYANIKVANMYIDRYVEEVWVECEWRLYPVW